MTAAAAVLACLAGLLHVGFFAAESLLWGRERVWRAFGARSAEQAKSQRVVFFNLGFYNLFLGLGAWSGAAWLLADGGVAFVVYVCVFMVAAGVVLAARTPRAWPGAVAQAGPPAVALAALALA